MPELPEVESVRRALETCILNRRIISTTVRTPKIIASKGNYRLDLPDKTDDFKKFCNQKTIQKVSRRAKNIFIELDSGYILTHFKMTGQLLFLKEKPNLTQEKHIHILWELDQGWLAYKDIRKFGYVLMIESREELESHFTNYGMEPLSPSFDFEVFREKMKKSSSTIKKIFLDQKIVVGLGNIYADEVCFMSGVRPMRKGSSLTKQELKKLYENIQIVLRRSIETGGTTKYTHTLPDGSQGRFVEQLQVYGRAGEKCFVCSTPLIKEVVAGRTTVYCKMCQK